jgi:hypothetical protein
MIPTDQDNLRTGLDLMASPNTWVEAHPHVPLDAADVGGDIQAGTAWGRRFIRWHPKSRRFLVLNVYHFPAEAVEDNAYLQPPGIAPNWIVRQIELMVCVDFLDPGSTEEWSDYLDTDLPDDNPLLTSDDAALALAGQVTVDNLPLQDLLARAEQHLTP